MGGDKNEIYRYEEAEIRNARQAVAPWIQTQAWAVVPKIQQIMRSDS